MNQQEYEELYDKWVNRDLYHNFWTEELAKQYNMSSREALRSALRRYRKTGRVPKKGAKILLFDIETSPINALVWGIWEQNINIEAILQDWHLVSWSAKWLFDDGIISDVLTSKEAINHDDERIAKSIWELLNQADITVAHNGDKFDHKMLNTRFLVHNLPPLSHYKSIDTLVVAKSSFRFTSNSLAYINQYLGIPEKTKTTFDLWKRAFFGEEEALEIMKTYNENDVFILEELFLKLRPYIKNFPNMNLYTEENTTVCRNCGSKNLTWSGYYYTNVNRYRGWRCNSCGAIGRDRHSDIEKEKKETIVV